MSDIFVRSSETWGNNNFTVVSVISRNQDDVNFYLLLIVENSSYTCRKIQKLRGRAPKTFQLPKGREGQLSTLQSIQ